MTTLIPKFQQTGTGAVNQPINIKLQEYVSAFDFLTTAQIADVQANTALVDVSSALQACINAAKGRPILLPKGTYRIDTALELNWSTSAATIYQDATKLIGENTQTTIILNRSNDYGLKHTVSAAQASNLSAGVRMSNGELAYFTLTVDGTSPAGASGIKLFSYWFGYIHDINISNSKGNGLYLPKDVAISANPDRYSCGVLTVERCDIRSSVGWGVRAELFSITWLLYTNYIVNNEAGGVYTTGAGHQFQDNAIAGNGTLANIATSAGIRIAYGAESTPHNVTIHTSELQDNWGTHLWIEGYDHNIYQNRFLQDGTAGAGATDFRNNYCVYLDATDSGSAFNINVLNNTLRFDNAGAATIIGFNVVDAPNSYNDRFIDNVFTTAPAGLTKYNFPTARSFIYGVEDGLQVASSGGQVQYNFPQMSVVTPLSTLMTTAGDILNFGVTYDPQTRYFAGGPNMKYVPQYSGLLSIEANLVIKHVTTANTPVTITIKKNGVDVIAFNYSNGFPTTGANYAIAFSHMMKIDAGDGIEIWGTATTASNTYSISNNTSVTFKMQ